MRTILFLNLAAGGMFEIHQWDDQGHQWGWCLYGPAIMWRTSNRGDLNPSGYVRVMRDYPDVTGKRADMPRQGFRRVKPCLFFRALRERNLPLPQGYIRS